MKKLSFILCLLFPIIVFGQQEISVENIWRDYTFYPKSVPGFTFMKDGKHYVRQVENRIQQYDLLSGEAGKLIFDPSQKGGSGFAGTMDGYSFNNDETKILVKTESESIYRHSTRANFYVWDAMAASFKALSENGKQRYATFNKQSDKVAFVRQNNLFVKDLASGKEMQLTQDGKYNHIINGATDWVYEEEFALAKGFAWSPDGKKIAFLRFDESEVKEFTMLMYNDDAYPEPMTFKYPKVGEDNAKVSVHIYDLESGKKKDIALGDEAYYIPRIRWTKDANKLVVYTMNRYQNQLRLMLADAKSGEAELLLEEKSKYYIDITDDLTFLKDGKHFIWTSEKDGYNQIYLYNLYGEMVRKLTPGEYDVTKLYGVDEDRDLLYYESAEESPLERHIYSINLKGKKKNKLTQKAGWNEAQFSSTYDYYVLTHSSANTAPTYAVYDHKGNMLRSIEENEEMSALQSNYNWQPIEFFEFETVDKTKLNGFRITPPNFDESKKYPVLMYVYGGPGSQTVQDKWNAFNGWWFQMLAQQGYIIVSVDNRGTGARGEEFKKMTYLQLGKYETEDQIAAARWLAAKPYVDANRIGIWGWSYGGYMSSLALLKGNDVFKTAIAVAPVTNWKWYDTIYTERYMRTDDENEAGYRENSPVYFTDRLKGNYLIVHGLGDDNVHPQNSFEMTNALIKSGKQFDSYFYPNRNHGIYGGNTRLHLYYKMTNFLKENL